MPKSKRAKVIHLTRTAKKGRDNKAKLLDQIREHALPSNHIYLFQVRNMRNQLFKDLRTTLPQGRFFIGKNRVMATALGRDEASELLPGLSHLTNRLRGDLGLLFVPLPPTQIQTLINSHQAQEFARTGTRATFTVIIEADPEGLRNVETGELLSATVEPQLCQAGMPTKLRGGNILLNASSFTVCRKGEPISANAARILKVFGIKMATFRVCLVAHYHDGTFEEYIVEGNEEGGENFENLEKDDNDDKCQKGFEMAEN